MTQTQLNFLDTVLLLWVMAQVLVIVSLFLGPEYQKAAGVLYVLATGNLLFTWDTAKHAKE
jgi:O-antigen/teichoic acid export membrane protein